MTRLDEFQRLGIFPYPKHEVSHHPMPALNGILWAAFHPASTRAPLWLPIASVEARENYGKIIASL
jgi:hypothetical protein